MRTPLADPNLELAQDFATAQAELAARCEALLAECEERRRELAGIEQQVASGDIDRRTAQTRIRQLLHERTGMAGVARAGRTTIGLSAPSERPKSVVPVLAQRLTPAMTEGAVRGCVQAIEERMVMLLSRPVTAAQRSDSVLELSLLIHAHRGLELQLGDLPKEQVLLEYVQNGVDDVSATLADLEAGAGKRALRLVQFVRALASEAAAVGIAIGAAKQELQRAHELASGSDEERQTSLATSTSWHARLTAELDKQAPLTLKSLLDELVRSC